MPPDTSQAEVVVETPAVVPAAPAGEQLPEGRKGDVVVTNSDSSFHNFVTEKLGGQVAPTDADGDGEAATVDLVNPDPDAVAKEQFAKIEAERVAKEQAALPKEGDKDGEKTYTNGKWTEEGAIEGSKVFFKGKWVGKNDFEYRLHVKTNEREKEFGEKLTKAEKDAADKIAAAETKAREAVEAREQSERESRALKKKYEPVKELGPEPQPSEFTDASEYGKAVKEWAAESTKRELAKQDADAKAQTQAAKIQESWNEKFEMLRKEEPEFDDLIKDRAQSVRIHPNCMAEIVQCDNGPRILMHLLTHPDEVKALGEMTLGAAFREIGRLDVKVAPKEKARTEEKKEIKAAGTKVVEISTAPAPISPLKGLGGAPLSRIDSQGNYTGTVDEFRADFAAGRIK